MSHTTDYDREKAKPDIIDNREARMADVLNINLPRMGSLDISSGYFEVSGYEMIRHTLEDAMKRQGFKFRLMIGKNAIRTPTFGTFEEHREHAEEEQTLQADLGRADLNPTHMDSVASLIATLKHDNVQVRLGRSKFNHAKCYIMGMEGVIIGSSNLTKSGLSGNDELNSGVYVTGTWKKVKEWYERMWEGATDAKADIIEMLEQSKFGVPAKPYEIYLKILFEKYRRILDVMDKSDPATAKTLAKFQQQAVYSILQTIDEYGGAILADSTGLGKTHIGLEVMRKKVAEGKKVLLVAPAQIRDTVWKAKLEEAQIFAKIVGTEELGREEFPIHKYRKYDFVIVDESQNFRSKSSGRWNNLMKIVTPNKKKQVLLMSATPINNTIMDLYYQLCLITGRRDDAFIDIGIYSLYDYLRRAAKHKLDDGLEKIQLLLDAIMIRRTRTFIQEVYPDEEVGGRRVTFPKRDYKPIRYEMADLFGNIFADLQSTVKSLKMTPYGIEKYNTSLTEEERHKHEVLASLQVTLLLKRFESSAAAVTISIKNKITLFEYFQQVLEKGRIISPRQFSKIMIKWNAHDINGDDNDEQQQKFFMDEIKKIPLQDASTYDVKSMKKDVKCDLEKLNGYLKGLADLPKFDKKAEAVAEMILRDRALDTESRKVLVFTEYEATAKHISKFFKDRFPNKNVELITGSVKKQARADIIRRFSPVANTEDEYDMPDTETDILVSTEVLSEGQNLQDCNYVVNYDLPWNPMRIVQRIGRVDRLTSTHEVVHSRECFPEKHLDKLLNLTRKLSGKITDINNTIGMDTDLLGQEATIRNFKATDVDRIWKLASGDADDLIDEMERESDMMSKMSPINEISQYIRKAGIMKMREFPMGRRSGKAGKGQKVVLAYIRESPRRRFYSVVYDYASMEAEIIDSMEAIMMARCREDEETYLPMDVAVHSKSFEELLMADGAAREAIQKHSSAGAKIAQDLRNKPKKNAKVIGKIRDIMDGEIEKGNLTIEEAEAVDPILDSPDILQWTDHLEEVLDQYDAKHDIKSLVSQISEIGENIGIEADEPKDTDEKPGPLILVGAMFVTGA